MALPLGTGGRVVSLLRSVAIAAMLCVGARFAAAEQALVPAVFAPQTDALGFIWDVQPNGQIQSGSNTFAGQACTLMVNNHQVAIRDAQMTPDGSELVLSANVLMLEIKRRIRVDTKASLVRYVEIIHNTTALDVPVSVSLTSSLRASGGMFSNLGAPNPNRLADKESAVIAISRISNYPSALFWVADPRAKLKPTLAINGSRNINVTYQLNIPAGKTVAVVHGVAQRNITGGGNFGGIPGRVTPQPPDPKAMAALLAPFQARTFLADLSPEVRRTLANHTSRGSETDSPAPGQLLQSVLSLADQFDIDRDKADTLVIDEDTRLRGTASCDTLSITTRYGKAKLDLADVALLRGGAAAGRPMLVYLRNGEILAGPMEADKLILKTETGLEVDLLLEQMDLLFLSGNPKDGTPTAGTTTFITTSLGDRLALTAEQPGKLRAAAIWGETDLAWNEVSFLHRVQQPQPSCRTILTDQSRLYLHLLGGEIELATLRWGSIKTSVQQIRRIDPASKPIEDSSTDAANEPDAKRAYCRLLGDNLLFGTLSGDTLHVATPAGITPIPIKDLRDIERRETSGSFQFTLTDGNHLAGTIQEPMLSIEAAGRTWQIPTPHMLAIHRPDSTQVAGDANAQ